MKLTPGQVVQWSNHEHKRIIWLICDDLTTAVVIHSDDLIPVGTLTHNIHTYVLEPFIGTVNITSK